GRNSCLATRRPPELHGAIDVRQNVGAVDDEERGVVYPDVARILQDRDHVADEGEVRRLRVRLLEEDVVLEAVPAARPVLVRPADAEREVWPSAAKDLVERPLEQTASAGTEGVD